MARGDKSGGGRQLTVRVRKTRRRKPSSTDWLTRQLNDPFVAEARRQGYRSRAAFKLQQLDERFRLIARGAQIVDLGCAPGGWSQVAVELVGPTGAVVGVDLSETDSLPGVTLLRQGTRRPIICASLASPRTPSRWR